MDFGEGDAARMQQANLVPTVRLEPAPVNHVQAPVSPFKSPFDYQAPPSQVQTTQKQPGGRRWRWARPRWLSQDSAETFVAKCLPLSLHTTALATLIAATLMTSAPFLSIEQANGPGRLDLFLLNSCATQPDNLARICTPRSLRVSFLPSMAQVTDFMPGVVAVQLPFESTEAPPVVVTASICLFLSLLLYITLWMLTFYPHTKLLPRAFVDFARYRARQLFLVTGSLSFVAAILTTTISLGLKLYFIGYRNKINQTMQLASMYGYVRGGATVWRAELGPGFDIMWASTAMQILTVLAVNVALRYGIDERVEWPKDEKDAWA
ncbi:hypothetical protein ACM66B_000848 [Microbotryomycetes sp. NB124-2]